MKILNLLFNSRCNEAKASNAHISCFTTSRRIHRHLQGFQPRDTGLHTARLSPVCKLPHQEEQDIRPPVCQREGSLTCHSSAPIKGVTHCTTDYLNFCMDIVVPIRTVCCFPNNKPWITSNVKDILNRKKRAFRDGDRDELKHVQGELNVHLREAKEDYRRKLEQRLQHNNMREVWDGMKTITGCKKNGNITGEGDAGRTNQLNLFFNRFDIPTPTTSDGPLHTPTMSITPHHLRLQTTPTLHTHGQFNPPPHHHHQGSGEQRAEEASSKESSRPGQSVSKDVQSLFC